MAWYGRPEEPGIGVPAEVTASLRPDETTTVTVRDSTCHVVPGTDAP